MKKAGIVALVVVLVLVIGAELFLFTRLKGCVAEQVASNGTQSGTAAVMPEQNVSGQSAPVAESVQMTAPPPEQPPAIVVTDVPVPTLAPATPVPTLPPEPAPTLVPATPTPVPTAAPTPTAVPSSTGSFSSATGTALDMTVDWSTEDLGTGTTRVYVTGRIGSYSLNVMSTSVTVTLAGQSTTCPVGAILIAEGNYTVTDLFSASLDVPSGAVGTMTVDWAFNGSYSGVDLPHITAQGTVTA